MTIKNKTCNKCGENKPTTEFHRNASSKDGYKSQCKVCAKAGKKVFYSKEYHRNKDLIWKYGITLEDYNEMLEEQDHCCAICGIHEEHCNKKLAVDHNHDTGKVRALLCHHCNTGLGYFKENIKFLNNAIQYVKDYN